MHPRTVVPAVLRTYIEGLKAHDLAKVAKTVSEDLVFVLPGKTLRKSQFLDMLRGLDAAFPDWRYDYSDPERRGDVIAIKWRQGGTHSGNLAMTGLRRLRLWGEP